MSKSVVASGKFGMSPNGFELLILLLVLLVVYCVIVHPVIVALSF